MRADHFVIGRDLARVCVDGGVGCIYRVGAIKLSKARKHLRTIHRISPSTSRDAALGDDQREQKSPIFPGRLLPVRGAALCAADPEASRA